MWKRLLLALVIAVAILLLMASRLDVSAVWRALAGVRWELLAVTGAIQATGLWLKAERWTLAIAAGGRKRPRARAFAATVIGNAANLLVPARMGDVLRALVLRRHNDVSASQALMAAWSVNLFDVVVVGLLLLASGSAFVPRRVLAVVLLAGLLALGTMALAHARSDWVRQLERRLLRGGATGLRAPLERARQGLRFLGHGRALAGVLGMTLLIWSCDVLTCLAAMHAFGVRLGLAPAAVLVGATALSFAIPLTPGNLGIFQALCVLVLGAFGESAERAFAFGLGAQGFSLVAGVAWGMALFHREGLDFAWLRRREGSIPP